MHNLAFSGREAGSLSPSLSSALGVLNPAQKPPFPPTALINARYSPTVRYVRADYNGGLHGGRKMTAQTPSIQFFEGISEELSNVSLRRNRNSGVRSVLMTFNSLKALEKFNSFTKRSSNSMLLTDEEGAISVEPSSIQIRFGGPEGDELQRVECQFEIEQEDHWERFMRFMHRYAQVNDMAYSETDKSQGKGGN